MKGLLKKGELSDRIDTCETLLRLGGVTDSEGIQGGGGFMVFIFSIAFAPPVLCFVS